MMLKKRNLKESLFECIFQIEHQLSQMTLLMGINRFLDYFVLIIGSIALNDQHLIQQIPFLGEINGVLKNGEMLEIVNQVNFGLAIIMVIGCGVDLIGRRGKRQYQKMYKTIGNVVVNGVVWAIVCYQVGGGVYLYLLAKNNDLFQLHSSQLFLLFSNLIFSLAYTYLFPSRKYLGKFFPLFFLFPIFFSTINTYIFTLAICIYLISSSAKFSTNFICLQIITLKSLHFISIILSIKIQMAYFRTVFAVIIVFPILSYLYYFNHRFEQAMLFQDGLVLKIGIKMMDGGVEKLSNRQITILNSFYQQSSKDMKLQQMNGQTFYEVFKQTIQKQISINPKNIRSYIYRIQLKYKTNKSMLKILHDLQALNILQTSKLSEQYEIYIFTKDIIDRYKLSNTLNYHQLQENDQRIQNNQSRIAILLKELLALWQYIKKSNIDEKIIMQILQKIDNTRKQIESNITFFESADMRNYLLINQYAIKCLYPQYEMRNIQQDNKSKSPIFHKALSCYILLINDKFDSISFNLAKKLGLDPFFIKNLTKQDLFPSFLKDQQEISLQNRGIQGQIPLILINSQANMQIFKGNTSIFHILGQRLCYFMHLQEIDQQNQPYLLINTQQNNVEYKTPNFNKYFMNEDDVQKIDIDILFCQSFSSFKASKKSIGHYEIKLNQNEKKLLQIEKICTFQRNGISYILIKIYITKNIGKNERLNLFIQHSITKRSQNKWQTYQRQSFFCRIPHPFEIKYNQVLEHLQDKQRLKTSHVITAIFIVIIILIIGCFGTVKGILKVQEKEFITIVDQIITVNEAKNNIILLYQQSYKLYYLRLNNVTFSTSHIDSNKTITQIYINQINSLIRLLQDFKYRYNNQILSFLSTRKFQLFQFNSNIDQTSAMLDILQLCKKYLMDNNILLLVYNFGFISQFQHSLQIEHLLTQKVIHVQATIIYIFITCIILITIIIILTYSYMYRSYQWGRNALKLMINYPQAMIDSTIHTLQNFSTFINNNQNVYYTNNRQQFEEESVSELFALVQKQRLKQLNSQQQLRKKDAEYLSHLNETNKGSQDQYLYNITQKNIIYQGITVFLLKNSYFMFTIFACVVYFLRFQAVNTQISIDKLNIKNYLQQAYEIQRNIITQSVVLYQKTLQNYYNISNQINYRPASLATILQEDLPAFFKEYQQQQKILFQENLCLGNLTIKNGIYFAYDDCLNAIMGALRNGMSIAYSSYITLINSVYEQTALTQSSFIQQKGYRQKLQYLDLAQRLMYQRIQQLKRTFRRQVQLFINNQMKQILLFRILQEIVLIAAISIGWYYGINKHKNRCNIMVNSFKMLRKDYILSKLLLKYCNKNQIFENITKI